LRFFGRFSPSFGVHLRDASRRGFRRLASSLCFGRLATGRCLRNAALFFFCCFALRFLSGFSPSFPFGGYALLFGGFTLRFGFRFSSSLGLCFFCLTASFGLRLRQSACLGFYGSTPRFGLRLRHAPRLGFCRLASSLYFGRLTPGLRFGSPALFCFRRFALRLRLGHSPRLCFFCQTPCFGLRLSQALRLRLCRFASSLCFGHLAAGLRFGSTALLVFCCFALRFLSGFSPSFRLSGSALRCFGRFALCFGFRFSN
jgi:hypothetical protein